MKTTEQWLPEDSDGVIYVQYDDAGFCRVNKVAMTALLKRARFQLHTTEIEGD